MPDRATAHQETARVEPSLLTARWGAVLAGTIIILAGLAAYHNSFAVPFIFDDLESVIRNPTIRRLWPVWQALSPSADTMVGGRPVVNLTLAINYALGGTTVWGYHVVNLAIHVFCGLTLFGIIRCTLRQPALRERYGAASLPLALAATLIWAVHPLQTEAVTYVSQRAELLMGLFYLLTMYCFIRGTGSARPGIWFGLCVAACVLGMASKEVMVTAPLMVLLYDRVFVAGNFRKAWAQRWRLYVALASPWLLLGWFMIGLHHRGVGYGLGATWWSYGLTECGVVVHYLWLTVWPHPLVFDYGRSLVPDLVEALPYALTLAVLAGCTVVGVAKGRPLGFAGAWLFVILAPASSVVPVAGQPMAEHRMYLPLAAVVMVVVAGIHRLAGRRTLWACVALALGLGFLTTRRNEDYRSEMSLWMDTLAKRPNNARAHYNLGSLLLQDGRTVEAIEQQREALRLEPDYAEARYNLALALQEIGNLPEAIEQYEQAARLHPDDAQTHNNLGSALQQAGRLNDAKEHYEQALRLKPDYARAYNNLGLVLFQLGRVEEARAQYEEALRIEPNYAKAHNNLGIALLQLGKVAEARAQYEEALRLQPDYREARNNLTKLDALQRTGSPKN